MFGSLLIGSLSKTFAILGRYDSTFFKSLLGFGIRIILAVFSSDQRLSLSIDLNM